MGSKKLAEKLSTARSERYRLRKMNCWYNVDHWRVPTIHGGMIDKETRADAIAHLDAMEKEHGKGWWFKW